MNVFVPLDKTEVGDRSHSASSGNKAWEQHEWLYLWRDPVDLDPLGRKDSLLHDSRHDPGSMCARCSRCFPSANHTTGLNESQSVMKKILIYMTVLEGMILNRRVLKKFD